MGEQDEEVSVVGRKAKEEALSSKRIGRALGGGFIFICICISGRVRGALVLSA